MLLLYMNDLFTCMGEVYGSAIYYPYLELFDDSLCLEPNVTNRLLLCCEGYLFLCYSL